MHSLKEEQNWRRIQNGYVEKKMQNLKEKIKCLSCDVVQKLIQNTVAENEEFCEFTDTIMLEAAKTKLTRGCRFKICELILNPAKLYSSLSFLLIIHKYFHN